MIKAKKVRLFPTEEQEKKLWQSVGTARFIYNWTLAKQEETHEELANVSLGIDLGIKDLAVCSDTKVYKNINKSHMVRKIEKRLRRLQRQVSRKYEKNKKGKDGKWCLCYEA